MQAAKMDLNLEPLLLMNSIKHVLKHWSNCHKDLHRMMEHVREGEKIIISTIKSMQTKQQFNDRTDLELILNMLDSLDLQSCLVYLRIFLLEVRGDYL